MGEFRLKVAGKVYTIESTMDDCQRIGGDLMAIEYQMVCTLLFNCKMHKINGCSQLFPKESNIHCTHATLEMFQLTWILLVKLFLE